MHVMVLAAVGKKENNLAGVNFLSQNNNIVGLQNFNHMVNVLKYVKNNKMCPWANLIQSTCATNLKKKKNL